MEKNDISKDMTSGNPPLFIIGVPRSGTTLLRVMLDSHPNLAVGPECPWIAGSYGKLTSFKNLYEALRDDQRGPVKNFQGVTEDHAAQALGSAIDQLLTSFAGAKGKTRWVEKTPNHMADLPFILKLFPNARFVHIVRDGRDVACSSYKERKTWGPELWNPEGSIQNTRLNALRRWVDWIHRFEEWETQFEFDSLQIFYEDLVRSPREVLGQVLDFFGEPWSDNVLNYKQHKHDLPAWEAGSRDVAQRKEVNDSSKGRWQKEFSQVERLVASTFADPMLIKYGYEPSVEVKTKNVKENVHSDIHYSPVIAEPSGNGKKKSQVSTESIRVKLIRTDYPHLSAHSGLHQFVKFADPGKIRIFEKLIRMGDEELSLVPPEIKNEIKQLISAAGMKAYQGNDFVEEQKTLLDWSNGKFDILHYMDGEHTLQFLPFAMRKLSSVKNPAPVVATFHQPPSELEKIVSRKIVRVVDRVMVLTPEQRDWFREFMPAEKIRLILHGLDADFFKPADENPNDGKLRCLTVGNWLRDYGTVFRVAESLIDRNDIEFHCVTSKFDGMQLPRNVVTHSGISDEELLRLYNRCDAVFLPLTDATANNAILEGLGCGLAIIATDIPGVRAYVPGDEAMLVSRNNQGEYRDVILQLMNDRDRLDRMKQASRQRAEQLAWQKTVLEIEDMYAELMTTVHA